ncbi:MAG TPA: hypothetical protein VIX59_14375 [Candidatus Binataceae bacterium]
MRRIASLTLVAIAMLWGQAGAAPAIVLGTNGPLRGTYVCKGQGHRQNGVPSGLYIVLKTDGNNDVTGGELGSPLSSAFCTFSISTSSSISVDSENVGHLTLVLKPMAEMAQQPSAGGPSCRAITETFEFAGLNKGIAQIEFTETDNGVEAGGHCEQVSTAF